MARTGVMTNDMSVTGLVECILRQRGKRTRVIARLQLLHQLLASITSLCQRLQLQQMLSGAE